MHQIRQFLGLVGYYRRFIPDFFKIAQPMTKLLPKDVKFVWSPACEEAFQALILISRLMCIVMPLGLDWDVCLCKMGV